MRRKTGSTMYGKSASITPASWTPVSSVLKRMLSLSRSRMIQPTVRRTGARSPPVCHLTASVWVKRRVPSES